MSIKDNIAAAIKDKQTNPTQLAKKAKMTQPSLHRIMTGETKDPGITKIKQIANALGVSYGSIIDKYPTTNTDEVREQVSEYNKYTNIAFYRIPFSAGNGTPPPDYEEVENERAFRTDWLQKKGWNANELVIVCVDGDSMMPRLHTGDNVLINNTQTSIINGKVYALRYGDRLIIKRLEVRYDNALIINSDNPSPEYKQEIIPAEEMESGENVKIIGRVIHLVGGGGFD